MFFKRINNLINNLEETAKKENNQLIRLFCFKEISRYETIKEKLIKGEFDSKTLFILGTAIEPPVERIGN